MVYKASAQEIYFCSNISDKGEPIGASVSWTLSDKGGYIYIYYTNHKKHIKSKSLIARIMKKTGGNYVNYERRAMELENDNTFASLDYQFIEAGNYKVTVQDNTGKDLAISYLTIITINKAEPNAIDSLTRDRQTAEHSKDPARGYYHARTIFCKTILNGLPTDTGSVFAAGEVNVIVVNNQPLAADSMIVDVFKKGYESEKYPIYITTKTMKIDRNQNRAGFILNIDQTGQYKIVSYNGRSQTISEGYLTIR